MNDELRELIAVVMSQGETEAKLHEALENVPGHQVVVNGDTLIRQDYGTKRVIITRGVKAVSI